METQNCTNETLARDYLSVAGQNCHDLTVYRDIRRVIANSPIDINAFYQEHKNLNELQVPKIGKLTKRILQLILENGVADAREIFYSERVETVSSQKVGRKVIMPRNPDNNPTRDNLERALEDISQKNY